MKHILLLRHAKSSHDDSGLKDFDRPLATRGRDDAHKMGAFINNIGYTPGIIISSTAKRAEQTTRLLVEGGGFSEEIVQWNEALYYGSSGDYLKAVQKPTDVSNTIMLVGHNPIVEDIARRLCGSGAIRMPTAALVCLEQPANEWNQIREGLASLKWMMIPKVLQRIML